jgi:hypothetical protein
LTVRKDEITISVVMNFAPFYVATVGNCDRFSGAFDDRCGKNTVAITY